METVQSFLTYHAFEGGDLSVELARRYLIDAISDKFLVDADSIDSIDVVEETRIANETAARMAARMGYPI